MLLTCPLTRSEGFSIELFGKQNNSRNVVFTASSISSAVCLDCSVSLKDTIELSFERRNRWHHVQLFALALDFLLVLDPV